MLLYKIIDYSLKFIDIIKKYSCLVFSLWEIDIILNFLNLKIERNKAILIYYQLENG